MQLGAGQTLDGTHSDSVLCNGDPADDLTSDDLLQFLVHLSTLGGIFLSSSSVDLGIDLGIFQAGVVTATGGVQRITEHVVGVLTGSPGGDGNFNAVGGTVTGEFLSQSGILGLLNGEKATIYPAMKDELEKAVYSENMVVKSRNNIITSRGPGTAMYFALALIEELKGTEMMENIKEGVLL